MLPPPCRAEHALVLRLLPPDDSQGHFSPGERFFGHKGSNSQTSLLDTNKDIQTAGFIWEEGIAMGSLHQQQSRETGATGYNYD